MTTIPAGPLHLPGSIRHVFDRVLAEEPHREALIARSGRLSYAELDAAADRAAAALSGLGVRAGDRVAACLPNDLDIVVAFHGAMRIGAVWVGLNQALTATEQAFILGDAGARLLLCDSETASRWAQHDLPELTHVVIVEPVDSEWQALLNRAGPPPAVTVNPFVPAAIAYTSGTTGVPKGVMHSQYNLLLPGAVTVLARDYNATLRKGDCLPLTILNMMVLTTLLVAQAGG